jgi:multidrug transporter EmrE-like cation transporter
MKTLSIAILSIALSVAAQFSLKAGMSSNSVRAAIGEFSFVRTFAEVFTNVYVLAGFVLYGIGAVVWLGVLADWDVSKAYPLVGLGFVFTVAIGFMMGEYITLPRVLGVGLICTGVLLVGRS